MRMFTLLERSAAAMNTLPVALYDAFPAVLFGRILVISARMGVFELLALTPLTADEVASRTDLHPEAAGLLCSALHAAGYLRVSGDRYSLSAQSRKWLVGTSPHFIGNFLAYIELLHHRWETLEESLKKGKPPKGYVDSFTPREWNIYTLGMMDLARLTIPFVGPKLRLPDGAKRLLDCCGSHGLYAIELCRKYPDLSAVIADFPEVLVTTEKIVASHRLSERITLLPCDVTRFPVSDKRYDVVLAFNIVHGFDRETNRNFFRSISSLLSGGGTVYVLDQLRREGRRGAGGVLPLLVGINLMNEIGGSAYRLNDVRGWCHEAGLGRLRHAKLRLPGMDLVSARKI